MGERFLAYMYCESWMANKWPKWEILGVETLSRLEALKRRQKVELGARRKDT